MTRDVEHTAAVLRHMAAQESKRESRRKRRQVQHKQPRATARERLSPEVRDVLLALPRVGPTRADALTTHLDSLGDLAQLELRDLLKIPGIGPDTAARIYETVRGTRADCANIFARGERHPDDERRSEIGA
jgi:ERCC4-type nuclease